MGKSNSKLKEETLVFDLDGIQLELKIKVPLKEKLKKNLIFGLNSRLPIALILGFFGWRQEVLPLM